MDIVIPLLHPERLPAIIDEIVRATHQPYTLIVCSSASSAAVNRQTGLDRCKSAIVAFVDDDIRELPLGWNTQLAAALEQNSDIIAVSARLMNTHGRPGLNAADNFDLQPDIVRIKDGKIPTACCVFWRPMKARFDDRYLGSGFEDVDMWRQLMIEKGGTVAIANTVRVVHLHTRQEQRINDAHNKAIFMEKWNG